MEKKNKINVEKQAKIMQKQGQGEIHSDVLGSYTGTAEKDEVPEQDADDL